jgi:hypothetical protein
MSGYPSTFFSIAEELRCVCVRKAVQQGHRGDAPEGHDSVQVAEQESCPNRLEAPCCYSKR